MVVLCEGDPRFYGSYLHLHERLARPVPRRGSCPACPRWPRRPPPSAGRWSSTTRSLTVLPGTLPRGRAARPAGRRRRGGACSSSAARSARCGRRWPTRGLLDRACYVERAGTRRAARRAAGRRRPGRRCRTCRWRWCPGRGERPAGRRPGVTVVGPRPGRPGVADPGGGRGPRRGRRTWSATGPTWPGCRSGRGSTGTAPATRSRPSGPRSRWTWPPRAAGSRSSPPATPACSPWPPPCSSRPPAARSAGATSTSRCCRA